MSDSDAKRIFNSNTYYSARKEHLTLKERILLNNRFYFTFKYVALVLRSRKAAIRKVYDREAWAASSFEVFKLIEATGGKFHITGMDNISRSPGPVLFISNHMSTLETMVFPGLIAPCREVTFVVKQSLVNHPLFGEVMKSRNPIVVGRADPRKDLETVLIEGTEILSRGISIVIFPQSTRSLHFKPEEFNSLGVKLARRANVEVVPVAIKTDFWGAGKLIKELGPLDSKKEIYFKFGEPFSVTGNGKADNQKIIDFITASLDEWNQDHS